MSQVGAGAVTITKKLRKYKFSWTLRFTMNDEQFFIAPYFRSTEKAAKGFDEKRLNNVEASSGLQAIHRARIHQFVFALDLKHSRLLHVHRFRDVQRIINKFLCKNGQDE